MKQVNLQQLAEALRRSWSSETAFEGVAWTKFNPARGQCVVSSLVVQDYMGGNLQRYKVSGNGIDEMHYYNVLDDGTIIDTTGQQYTAQVSMVQLTIDLTGFNSVREKRLAEPETNARYELLKNRVAIYLASISN